MSKQNLTPGIILIVAVLAGGVFWHVNNGQSEIIMNNDGQELMKKNNEELVKVFKDDDSEMNPEKIDTSNWKTYRNNYYGYQISYPGDWEIFVWEDRTPDWKHPRSLLYIAKDCDLYLRKSKGANIECPNMITINTDAPGRPCESSENRTVDGRLAITASKAFYDIFTLKKGEDRKSLAYDKQSSCFIYDNIPRCTYKFANNTGYIDNNSCYAIRVIDSTEERKYLKIERAILDSLEVIKKIR